MKDLSKYKVLVWDYGNYPDVAIRLSKDFETVYYYVPTVMNAFPTHVPLVIGSNIPNVIKVEEWASVIMEVDLVYFCDSMEPYIQHHIRTVLGKPVFGSVFACHLEHDRGFLKETMKSLGLPVNAYYTANGIDELDELLKACKDVFVKSKLRGDMETWHHIDYQLSEMEIKRMKHDMGVYGSKETYIVETPIDGIGEIGMDTFTWDGKYPDIVLAGIEIKDAGYCGCMMHYRHLPEQLRTGSEAFLKSFDEMGYRGHYSNEMIISKDKRGFIIDQTCRIPQPPGSLMMKMISNYSEVVWRVANGQEPSIEFEKRWGVQLIIKSDFAEKYPSPLRVPEEYQDSVNIKNMTIDDNGIWWYNPNGIEMKEIGSVCAVGGSLEEAARKAVKIADAIEGFDIYIKTDAIDKAKQSLDKLKKAGISFI